MQQFTGEGNGKTTVLELLQKEGIFLPADCGGRGTCGKCRVRFLSAAPDPAEEEIKKLSEAQREAGMRLACRSCPAGWYIRTKAFLSLGSENVTVYSPAGIIWLSSVITETLP